MKTQITTAKFVILGGPALPIRKTLMAGEWLRKAIMGLAREKWGRSSIPSEISGHNLPTGSNHEHFFYLPVDSLNRGCIDSFFVHSNQSMTSHLVSVLKSLQYIKNDRGETHTLVLENFGQAGDFKHHTLLFESSRVWRSVSPYLHPWHKKKKFTVCDQLKKECAKRGWPPLESVRLVPYVLREERRFYPFSFHKIRSKKGLIQPDRQGGFWQLTFKNPVQGPLALGFGCHFGLGLFESMAAQKDCNVEPLSATHKAHHIDPLTTAAYKPRSSREACWSKGGDFKSREEGKNPEKQTKRPYFVKKVKVS